MRADLTELLERIAHCRGETSRLAASVDQFCASSISWWPVPRGSAIAIMAKQSKPIPTSIRSTAGMIANELRSCLDGLVAQLAIRNGQRPDKGSFPISKSQAIFNDDGLKKIRRLSLADQATIISLKPYREENPLLFGLHEADRTRKHQRLVTFAGQGSGMTVGESELPFGDNVLVLDSTFRGIPVPYLNYSAERTEMKDVGRPIQVAFGIHTSSQVRPTFSITYSEPEELKGLPVTVQLSVFAGEAEKIILLFN